LHFVSPLAGDSWGGTNEAIAAMSTNCRGVYQIERGNP
jgi:hypothetical protein